jgi:protein AbiQ
MSKQKDSNRIDCQKTPEGNKGLDFSKALLITKDSYISAFPFKIPSNQHKNLLNKEYFISQKFQKYILKYVKAVHNKDKNILNSKEYRFTTLINFHDRLGI